MSGEVLAINCITCNRRVVYQEVLTDKEAKRGRWLAKCQETNPFTSTTCDFWHWRSDQLQSPWLPIPGPSNQDFRPTPTNPASRSTVAQAAPLTGALTCRATGCRSTRIRKGCTSEMCKAHCIEADVGCPQAAHKVARPRRALLSNGTLPPPPFPLQTSPAFMLPPPPLPALSTQLRSTPEPVPRSAHFAIDPALSGVEVLPPPPWLRHNGSGKEEVKTTQKDTLQIQSRERAKHTVLVYAFLNDNAEPKAFEVQEGFVTAFVWPLFILNEAILCQAGLSLAPENTFDIFRKTLGHWTTVKIGHVIDITASPQVFIKASDVRQCKDLTNLVSSSIVTSPNIRKNLAGECAYVRRRMIEREISQSPAPFLKNRREYDVDRSPTTPNKRPRMDLDNTPTRPMRVMPYLQPLLLPKPTRIPGESERSQPQPSSSTRRPSTRRVKTGPKSWPADFHAVDIANCLQEIENSGHKEKVQAIFERHFVLPFKSSTFYDHQDRWKRASLATKDAFISAGQTDAGLWVHFMAANPARDAALKAARRRTARSVVPDDKSLNGHETVDISSDESSGSE
ncbi:hypothetical protein GALMADRAFT_147270 [Galerina marginata CBS 339.88]|uniref:Uncharacterized protein n=1 Tax=Galerina marginata (strain CBS 339.88) TaxID=685588 RepID=A0A067SKH0_GALM3|nr:hypothetical protein GALMADRAFT_147270 [Galerina marginata CBS 339.88]